MVLAGHRGVDKFQNDVRPNAINVTVAPILEGKRGSLAASFRLRAFVRPAAGVGINFVRRTVHDVNPATIRLPSRNAGSKTLVGISNAAVIFLFELVFGAAGVGVAAVPEIFDKRLALVVRGEFLKSGSLFVGDDVGDFLAQPFLVRRLHFVPERLLTTLLFFGHLGFLVILGLVLIILCRGSLESG